LVYKFAHFIYKLWLHYLENSKNIDNITYYLINN